MKRKALALMMAALLAVGLLASCGNKDAKETTKAKETTAEETTKAGETTKAAAGEDAETESGTVKIGVIQLAEHPALDASYEGFKEALKEAGYEEGKNLELDFNNAQGDPSNCETIANKLVNNNCDLVLAIATPAAQAIAGKTTDIPILATAITDFKVAGLVESNENPGTNVSGSSDMNPVEEQISLLQELLPDAKKIGIMYCSSEDNSIVQADLAKSVCEAKGLGFEEFTVSDSSMIQSVAESMIGKIDAVYIPTDNLLAEGMATVAMVTNANGLPCIVGEEGMVANGGLATYGLDYTTLGKMAGEMAVDILKNGKDVSAMPIQYISAKDCTLAVNSDVAAELDVSLDAVKDKAKDLAE
ncbi:ABC transporter substrate-binding protein [Lacrimispora sp. NSJ-141]|uniref:ABC transporter substrate-binding protein n=1 Tax=Lientehia hominis TaxID=2897778 RepID=A0AAP2W7Y1_9FIRM|nr:ABC transporter substrate-binding protein [Lientehia hominis]MCD2492883.1 ABC transporter substrate-binding protein [Lientehia hominis]